MGNLESATNWRDTWHVERPGQEAPRDFVVAATGTRTLPLIDPSQWEGVEPPEREWLLNGWIPHRQATYLTGPGSAGKSLLSQQLATCTALGIPFLGTAPRQTNALYLSCEDDADELHRRQAAICRALGVSMSALAGKLHLVSLAGHLDTLICQVDGTGGVTPTERFNSIASVAQQLKVGFLGLDNVAHLFAGNENIRSEVAGFVGLLNSLAIRIDGAVLLLGHPNKAGDSFSGSTAWENQVRSRLFMQTPDATTDRDMRVLSREKSNYAKNGEELAFRWHQWAFVLDSDLPPDQREEIAAVALANGDNAAFLACLRQRVSEGEGRLVGPSPGPNYAPSQFEGMTQAKGLKRDRLKAAMERLFAIGAIEAHTYRNTSKGRDVTVIREAPNTSSPNPEPPPRTAPEHCSRTTPNSPPEPPPAHTPLLRKGDGAASKAAATPARTSGKMILAPGETGDDVDLGLGG